MATTPRSPEARKIVRGLRKELQQSASSAGVDLTFSAAEEALLTQIADILDRKHDLCADYAKADDVELRVKLSTEIRLLEGAAERLLRKVNTEAPTPAKSLSRVSKQAQRAADKRWAPERSRQHG
jgi:hypothetical protein